MSYAEVPPERWTLTRVSGHLMDSGSPLEGALGRKKGGYLGGAADACENKLNRIRPDPPLVCARDGAWLAGPTPSGTFHEELMKE